MSTSMSEQTNALSPILAPLDEQEARAAVDLVRQHLGRELSDDHRFLGVELHIDKPSQVGEVPRRVVSVIVVDYAKRHTIEARVEMHSQAVHTTHLGSIQVAFTDEEIAEARSIAEKDSRVARFAQMQGGFVSEFGPDRAADNSRRVGLRYAVVKDGRPSAVLAHAVVDLSTRSLIGF